MLKENEILDFIQEDAVSEKKRHAKIGQDYYEGKHDIKNYQLFFYNADGALVEDKTRSNIKISHPFFTELVDQEVQYVLSSKNPYIRSDIPELQNILNEYFNENDDFNTELEEVLTGCVSKGFEYMYAYKNKDGKLAFQNADSMGVVEIEGKYASDGQDYYIYWYVERINKDKQRVKKIQVWDKQQTWYYTQIENGKLELDKGEDIINPRPHVLYSKGNDDTTYYEGLGFIPFFRIDNSRKKFSGLKPIKALIDDYDLMACGLSNNLQDASEYLVVVQGFQGNNLDELIQNTKTKKAIGVDEGGSVEFKTVEIPYQARQTKLDLDEKNIYRFGMGFNSAQLGDGNITNIVIKSRYALLDLKCNKLEKKLKQLLRNLVKIVIDQVNKEQGTDYQMSKIYFKFDREIITNASDNATIEKTDAEKKQIEINTILNLKGTLDDETLIKNICEILEIDYEEIKDKIPKPAEEDIAAAEKELGGIVG